MSSQEQLDILYQDEHLVAINKPAGLLVHRSEIDRHETRFAIQLLRNQIGQRVYPVHRLDKPTSGVLLFALQPEANRRLSQAFMAGQVSKSYLAVVRGYTAQSGHIDHPLSRTPDRFADADAQPGKAPQSATTDYRRLATIELPYRVDRYPSSRYSLVELTPTSGRKHQLRRHMKHINHPIIGDTTHGKSRHNRLFSEKFASKRLLLAATQIRFTHPATGEQTTIKSPLENNFSQLLSTLGWQPFG